MAEYDVLCVNCGCRAHPDRPTCPRCQCTQSIRYEVGAIHLLTALNNNMGQAFTHTNQLLSTLIELLSIVHPDAKNALIEQRLAAQAEFEAQKAKEAEELKAQYESMDAQDRAAGSTAVLDSISADNTKGQPKANVVDISSIISDPSYRLS